MARRAARQHTRAEENGDTCIDCHYGLVHELPDNAEARLEVGGEAFDPVATVRLRNAEGEERDYELAAMDPESATAEDGPQVPAV